jgi:hypothetical protein
MIDFFLSFLSCSEKNKNKIEIKIVMKVADKIMIASCGRLTPQRTLPPAGERIILWIKFTVN